MSWDEEIATDRGEAGGKKCVSECKAGYSCCCNQYCYISL